MRSHFDLELAQDLVTAQEQGRQVVTGSANLDLSRPIAWRIGDEAQRALTEHNPERLFLPLRASASIPGAFSPIMVDDQLHVDGAVFGQFHVIGDIRLTDYVLQRLRAREPNAPLPKIRYWIIVNNIMREQPMTVQPRWTSVISRANSATLKHLVAEPMNLLANYALLVREKYNLDIDVKWVAIPQEFQFADVSNDFDPQYTTPLADLGAELGANPESWKNIDDLGVGELDRNLSDDYITNHQEESAPEDE